MFHTADSGSQRSRSFGLGERRSSGGDSGGLQVRFSEQSPNPNSNKQISGILIDIEHMMFIGQEHGIVVD